MVHLRFFPSARTLFDQPMKIVVSGLNPNQKITLVSQFCQNDELYGAFAHYEANNKGQLSTVNSESVGGSFKGLHPMGIFWGASQLPGQRPGLRFFPRIFDKPYKFEISLLNGHIHWKSVFTDSVNVLARSMCERNILHPDIVRLPVTEGSIRGTLFIPKRVLESGERVPGIIDIYGTAGGLLEYRAAMLANHGFAVLALAYFRYKDLPQSISQLDLKYFKEAIDWFSNHPNISQNGIGLQGISFGSDIAVYLSTKYDVLRAIVPINVNCTWEPMFSFLDHGIPVEMPE